MLLISGVLLGIAYLLGSIPSGVLVVKIATGKDVRKVASGRTGGTNAMRAAGPWAGLMTVVLDFFKGAVAVWLVRLVLPEAKLVQALAPLAAILGHNYSIFLMERTKNGLVRLRGGAGGATMVGGAFGLWPFSLLIIAPLAAVIFFGIGYASVTTMSTAIISTLIFAARTWLGESPWQYILYGPLAEALLIYALIPNIKRLFNGTERLSGWRWFHKVKTEDS